MEGLSLLMLEAKVSVDGNLSFQPWKLIFPSTETLLSNVGNLPFQPREFFWKPYTTGSLVGRSGVLSNEVKKATMWGSPLYHYFWSILVEIM